MSHQARREGVHVTFRPASHQWKMRPYNDDAVTIGGQLFDASVPEKLLNLTMLSRNDDLDVKLERQELSNERVVYAYRPHARPDAVGTTRWASPFAVGSLRSEQVPESMRHTRTTPLVDLKGRQAPPKTLTASVGDLPLQQRLTAGTSAHSISMNRRSAVEGANGNLKANFTNVDRGYARVFGTERVALVLAFTLAGLNAFLARSHRRMLKAEQERGPAPRTRKRRRKNTYEAVLGPAPNTTTEGRAPP